MWIRLVLVCCFLFIMGCPAKRTLLGGGNVSGAPNSGPGSKALLVTGKLTRKYLGKTITVAGRAANAKLGPQVICRGFSLWIDGMQSWPDKYYSKKGGRRVRVTGVLIERHDLPVFIHKPGDPIMSGMPVPPGTDLKKARHRYLLKNVRWKLLP